MKPDDYANAEEVIAIYKNEQEKQLSELNKLIVSLRTKVAYLEKELVTEREEREKIPLPKSVIQQVVELELKNQKLEQEIAYWKRFVPKHVIINKENKEKPTRRGGIPK